MGTKGPENPTDILPERLKRRVGEAFDREMGPSSPEENEEYLARKEKFIDARISLHFNNILARTDLDKTDKSFREKYFSSPWLAEILHPELVSDLLGDERNGWIYRIYNDDESDLVEKAIAVSSLIAMDSIADMENVVPIETAAQRDEDMAEYIMNIGDFIAYRYRKMERALLHLGIKQEILEDIDRFYEEVNERPLRMSALTNFFRDFDYNRTTLGISV